MISLACGILTVLASQSGVGSEPADAEKCLRLIPFPRGVELTSGTWALPDSLVLRLPSRELVGALPHQLREEASRIGMTLVLGSIPQSEGHALRLMGTVDVGAARPAAPDPPDDPGGYSLVVTPNGVAARAGDSAGLFHAAQTLRQLLRANVADDALPCLTIRDWPALRYRGFQDDLTRGPSTKLGVLKREVDLGALAKMNLFTYYLEHQFVHPKHPDIAPPDGAFSAEELQALAAHASRLGVDILGCQQSFGHFHHLLKHERYKDLRETGNILCPVKEESYQLLDDLYTDQAPHTTSPFFNVCCDETYGLGEGPSKELAKEIGVGGVYARHLRRVHELVKKQGKRMMMWGDIILQHPEHLDQIPKDTIMLTWGYGPRENFEHQIVPFAESGYEFFVCPGVNCWSRQLPDFSASVTNIQNFVRDGVKHGALGMLNTTWDDDGENFYAPNWHGVLWGAECAWTGSTTGIADFNRRLGGVLFGERGDHFGQALELLSQLHSLPGYDGLLDRRFWQLDVGNVPTSLAAAQRQARNLLGVTRLAATHLRIAKADATVNADLIDYFLFGTERVQLMATRQLNFLRAAKAYDAALQTAGDEEERRRHLRLATEIIRGLGDQHSRLRSRYADLWERENKPYALDRVLARFDKAVATYEGIAERLQTAATEAGAGKALPPAEAVGLLVLETGVRSTRARHVSTAMVPETPWREPRAAHRCGIEVAAGSVDRVDGPIELTMKLPENASADVRLYQLTDNQSIAVPCQLDQVRDEEGGEATRLSFVLPRRLAAGTTARFFLYFGNNLSSRPASGLRWEKSEDGGYWIENEHVRLLLGREGAHLYRWIVKPTKATSESVPKDGTDLTLPGGTQYFGFADIGGAHRNSQNELDLVQAGPAMVRLRCRDSLGMTRAISIYADQPWVEVTLDSATRLFWNFDDARLFGGEVDPPATYLFADGTTGPVGKIADGVKAQVKRPRVRWSAKLSPRQLMLAMVTPETDALHCVGPGSGWGGVGIENSPPASHFVIYGGPIPDDPASMLNGLQKGLDFANQPKVTVHAWEKRSD